MPNSAVGSYFKEQPSGKWELHVPDDPASREYHRWPVGFVTTGFVRGRLVPTFSSISTAKLGFYLVSSIVILLKSMWLCV